MTRMARIAGSFAIVMIAYWAYALVAVPWIEPPAGARPSDPNDGRGGLVNEQLASLEGLFPPDAWELQNPMVLESDGAILLLQKHHTLPDGRLKIERCTIVFPYEGAARDETQRKRQSIILRAADGAILKFDKSLDLGRPTPVRLVRGELVGKVTISSDWKEPGAADDLSIATQDILLTEQTISTPHPVDFRWGSHFGRGRDMRIKLVPGQSKPGVETAGANVAGIESFDLKHVDRLHLELGGESAEQGFGAGGPADAVPVDIHCTGPFRFDVVHRVATFRDDVTATKPNADGPPDQISADVLSAYFSPPSKNAAEARKRGSLDMAARQIVAEGKPVVVVLPSRKNVVVRAERLAYDLQTGTLAMDGGQEVFLQQGASEVHARNLQYRSAGKGRLGQIDAQGPGWLRAESPDRPGRQLEARWNDMLQLFPHEGNHVISLAGEAQLKFPGVGRIQSPTIWFWLAETPRDDAAPPPREDELPMLRPIRMKAENEVLMESPEGSGAVHELEVWFKERAGGGGRETGEERREERGEGREKRPATAVAGVNGQPAPPAQPFRFAGQRLQAEITLGGAEPALSNLTIEGGARFEGRGMKLTSSNVNLKRDTNRVWIDGPGQMELPIAEDLDGRPVADPGTLVIDWRRGMEFDGQTARFEDKVVATAAQRTATGAEAMKLDTNVMKVKLQRPVRVAEPTPGERPEIEQIECEGGVNIENRSFDREDQPTAFHRLKVPDAILNIQNGALSTGPGELNSVFLGTRDGGRGTGDGGTEKRPATAVAGANQLSGLRIKFDRSIVGNFSLKNRSSPQKLVFSDNVSVAYAPVRDWSATLTTTNPDQLGPDGLVVHCDQLTVVQMLAPATGRPSIEVEALGNARVLGAQYTARGHRITYDEAKQLLILRGNGSFNPAELLYQTQPGAQLSPARAQEFYYWLKTKQWKVGEAQSLEINQLPKMNGR